MLSFFSAISNSCKLIIFFIDRDYSPFPSLEIGFVIVLKGYILIIILMMAATLQGIAQERYVKDRKTKLQQFKKEQDDGYLNIPETKWFMEIYDTHFQPDENHPYFDRVDNVLIITADYNSKCYAIEVDGQVHKVKLERLVGCKRNNLQTRAVTKGMRYAIETQIWKFKRKNPLDPDAICPVNGGRLGNTAQVDHIIPFAELKDEWLKDNTPTWTFNDQGKYEIDEPFRTQWCKFHADRATYRYTSKQGNSVAHLLIGIANLEL